MFFLSPRRLIVRLMLCFAMPVHTIAVLGGVVQDLITIIDRQTGNGETVIASQFTMQAGGQGSNSAVAAYRLTRPNPKNKPKPTAGISDKDVRVRMVGAVGADQFGPLLRQNLAACGVNVDGVRMMETEVTGVANILVEAGSGANRIMQFPGAAYALEPKDFLTLESLGGGIAPDFVIAKLEIGRVAIEQAIMTAHLEGVDFLLNPSPARYLRPGICYMIGHLVMNETEAVILSRITPDDIGSQTEWSKVAEYFLNLGVRNVVITLGEKGAYYFHKSKSGYVPAEKNCTVLDTSGAG